MPNPYSSVSITGYNASPPPDDGSQTAANEITWAGIKTKLPDPLKTAIEAVNANLLTAFAKIAFNGRTAVGANYTILVTDQGKVISATNTITLTLPAAADASTPFMIGVKNDGTGVVTVDGNGSELIDGVANKTVNPGEGYVLYSDGSAWYTAASVLPSASLGLNLIGGSLVVTNSSGALTIAIKTLAGNDPSAGEPVRVAFRDATAATGTITSLNITAATSLVLSSGSTLGTANNTAFRVWIVGFNDGGTFRLGAINCTASNASSTYPLGQFPIASSTAEGGAGAADSAGVFYTGTAVTSKPYTVLAYITYESGLSTAGTWSSGPTRLHLFGNGTPLPGQRIQSALSADGVVATGTTVLPGDNTIPQSGEGTQFLSQAITPTSAANVLSAEMNGTLAHSASGLYTFALFQDSVADALSAISGNPASNNAVVPLSLKYRKLAGTTSSTTLKIRGGSSAAGTATFNGAAGGQLMGGVMSSYLFVEELMA